MKKIQHSLLIRIVFMVILTLILSMTAIGLFGYFMNQNNTVKLLGEKALAIAQTVADEIDANEFAAIMTSGEKNEYWYSQKEYVDKVFKDNELLYLYILDKNYDTEVTYFIEGYSSSNDRGEEEIDLGDNEDVQYHHQELFDTINIGKPHVTGIYDSDGFGVMLSGFAPIIDENGKVAGVVGIDIGITDVMNSSYQFMLLVIIFIVIANICLGFYITWYMKLKIGKPISELTDAAKKISKGDIEITLDTKRRDEIGSLVNSFNEMIVSTKSQAQVLETLSNGDLTIDINPRSKNDITNIALQKMIRNLGKMFAGINNSTMQVSTAAKQIANGSQALAQGSTQQASAVEELSCSIAEIAHKTKENANLASNASKLGDTIKNNAQKGSAQMEHMVQAVKDIGDSSRSIGKIIKLIDDIAFQTNILALNAAVEAARAGQHGKGFAIVAEEVRSLASKSAEAAKDTGSLITDSIEKTELGVSIANETAESLSQIVSGINDSSRIVGEIAVSSEEQTVAIDQINKGIEQVAQVVAQNSSTAQESAAASEEMSGQAAVLEDLVSQFKFR